jgi:hypothetical protein
MGMLNQFDDKFSVEAIEEFVDLYEKKTQGDSSVWIPTELTLRDIPDERIPSNFSFPKNCDSQKIHQAVTKVSNKRYFYDQNIEEGLKKDPTHLQIQIRNVHELLRVKFSNAQSIRLWTRILHDPNFERNIRDFDSAHRYLNAQGVWFN